MDKVKKKIALITFEIAFLATGLSFLFYYTWSALVEKGLPDDKYTSNYALSAVLLFDILWLIAITLYPPRKFRLKLYPTLYILTLSSAYLAYVIVGRLLGHAMH